MSCRDEKIENDHLESGEPDWPWNRKFIGGDFLREVPEKEPELGIEGIRIAGFGASMPAV
jgi:hypothetical protein